MGKILEIYESRTQQSAQAAKRAEQAVVGGNSRGAAYWTPYPLTIERASGTTVVDLDGHEYIDITNNYDKYSAIISPQPRASAFFALPIISN